MQETSSFHNMIFSPGFSFLLPFETRFSSSYSSSNTSGIFNIFLLGFLLSYYPSISRLISCFVMIRFDTKRFSFTRSILVPLFSRSKSHKRTTLDSVTLIFECERSPATFLSLFSFFYLLPFLPASFSQRTTQGAQLENVTTSMAIFREMNI